MNSVSIPKSAFRLAIAAVFAIVLAGAGQVRPAQANNWVGPAILGAFVGGAIAHSAYRNRYYYPAYPRRYARGYYRRPYYPPAYYAPRLVIPLPYVYFGPAW